MELAQHLQGTLVDIADQRRPVTDDRRIALSSVSAHVNRFWEGTRGVAVMILVPIAVIVAVRLLPGGIFPNWTLWNTTVQSVQNALKLSGLATSAQSWKLSTKFLIVTAGGMLVMLAIAVEWTRKFLVGFTAIFFCLMLIFVIRAGYVAARQDITELPLASAAAEAELLSDTATKAIANKTAQLQTTRDRSLSLLQAELARLQNNPPAGGDVALRDQIAGLGNQLTAELSAGRTAGAAGIQSLINNVALPADPATQAVVFTFRGISQSATTAFAAEPPTPAVRTDLDDALARAAALGRPPPAEGATGEQLANALKRVQIEFAEYRAAVDPTESNKAAVSTAVVAAAPDVDVSFADAVTKGPDAIVRAFTPTYTARLLPGVLGLVLLVIGLLIALRTALRLNDRRQTGPVELPDLGANAAPFKIALLRNIPSPAASPGGQLTTYVTDLVSVAAPATDTIQKALAAVANLVNSPVGYKVHVETNFPPAADKTTGSGPQPPPTAPSAFVRVARASSGKTLHSKHFTGTSSDAVLSESGHWAAAAILSHSKRIPSWARWDEESAGALAATTMSAPTASSMKAALRQAPTSGILLLLYGNALAEEGKLTAATFAYARAVINHPRYLISMYRFAVSLGMLAPEQNGVENLNGERALLNQALKALGLSTWDDNEPETLANIADSILQLIWKRTWWHRLLGTCVYRSQRDAVVVLVRPLWGWNSPRQRFRRIARSALFDPGDKLETIQRWADDPNSWWQISYNQACRSARLIGNPPGQAASDECFNSLKACLTRRGAHQLTVAWLEQDPDLAAFRNGASDNFTMIKTLAG